MRVPSSFGFALSAALSMVACDRAKGDGEHGEYVPLDKSSWEVALTLTVASSMWPSLVCESAHFTLSVEPSGDSVELISGRDGVVLPGQLALAVNGQPSPSYSANGELLFPTNGAPPDGGTMEGCMLSTVSVTELSLWALDDDFDGIADRIGADGKATGAYLVGDILYSASLSFVLDGVRDSHGPSLLLPADVHPLDSVLIRTSEPVTLLSTIDLRGASGDVSLTGSGVSHRALGAFSTDMVLPFGSLWEVAPNISDLGGLPYMGIGTPSVRVRTDPGLFAEDGFEAIPDALLSGSASVVSSVGTLPAIAGEKSLLVPPGSTATLHLARSTGIITVHFTTQALSRSRGSSEYAPPLEIAVIGGTSRLAVPSRSSSAEFTETNDAAWRYAAPKQQYDLALVDSGTDIVVRIAPQACWSICPFTERALLIDDLWVE